MEGSRRGSGSGREGPKMQRDASKMTEENEWWNAWREQWWDRWKQYESVRYPDGQAWLEWLREKMRVLMEGTPEALKEIKNRGLRLLEEEKKAREKLEEKEEEGRRKDDQEMWNSLQKLLGGR